MAAWDQDPVAPPWEHDAAVTDAVPPAPAQTYPIAPKDMPLLPHLAGTPWANPIPTPPAPSWSQVGREDAQFGKGAVVGALSSVPGTFGDAESIARRGLNALGADVSPQSALPTTERIGNYFAGPSSSPEDAMGRNIGAFLGPMGDVEAAKAAMAGINAAKTIAPTTQIMKAAKAARQSGFVLPPSLVKSNGIITDAAQAAAGKAKETQYASVQNQELVNAKAAKDLGLAPGTPITDATINDVKSAAGKKYQAVIDSVPKGVKLKFDPEFQSDITGLGTSPASAEFPKIYNNQKIQDLKDGLLTDDSLPGGAKTSLSPGAAIDLIRKLRKDATTNFKAIGQPESHDLALAQRDAADAVENLVERRLTQLGKPDVVKEYQAARQMYAKASDVEAATNTDNGNVSAKGLARLKASGRPLSGGLDEIATHANAFPPAFQNPMSFGGSQKWDALDYFGTAYALSHGNIPAAAAIASRPITRARLFSPSFQDSMVGIPTTPSGIPMSVLSGPIMRAGSPSPTLGLTPPSAGLGLSPTNRAR